VDLIIASKVRTIFKDCYDQTFNFNLARRFRPDSRPHKGATGGVPAVWYVEDCERGERRSRPKSPVKIERV
jgi:hypothetical protein